MTFPHPCSRCGMCCLQITCSVGRGHYKLGPSAQTCPGLSINEEGVATCALVPIYGEQIMGVGAGCCIKARAIAKDKTVHDFAGLPAYTKIGLVGRLLKQKQRNVTAN